MKDKNRESGSVDRNDVYGLKREVTQLRSIVMHLLYCQANGTTPNLELPAIREALYLRKDADVAEALERLQRTAAKVEGKAKCPECASMVEIRENLKPRCSFCGAEFDAPT